MKGLNDGRKTLLTLVAIASLFFLTLATERILHDSNSAEQSQYVTETTTPTAASSIVHQASDQGNNTPTPLPKLSPTPTRPTLRDTFDFQPLAVMIDNQEDARPQTGMIDADVVYEAVTEAGITRFMAIFANKAAPVVGPIRSARHYFVYWAREYNAVYVHAGASPQGYVAEENTGISRIDFTYGEGRFWRTADRLAPHNLYASVDGLRQMISSARTGTLGPVSFKKDDGSARYGGNELGSASPAMDDPFSAAPSAGEIVIIHPDGYRVGYVYDSARGDYQRYMLRQPHVDAANGEQYHPKNVIAQLTRTWRITGDTAGRVDMDLSSGAAYFFRDGKVVSGTWRKDSPAAVTQFLDETGHKVTFNPGQTWIQIVPFGGSVTFR